MERQQLSVSSALSQGWSVAKKHLVSLACIVLGIHLVSNLLSLVSGPNMDFWQKYMQAIIKQDVRALERLSQTVETTPAEMAVEVVSVLLMMILSAGFLSIIMQLVRGTLHKTSLSPYKMSVSVYAKYVVVSLFCGIIVLLAGMFCFIPGIYFNVRLCMAPYYVLENHNASVIEAIKASWQMTNGNFWSLLWLQIANLFIGLIGTCCCCIGVYLAIPVATANMSAAFYRLLPNYIPDAEYETL